MNTAEKEILKKRFGARIRKLREEKGLTLRGLAANCNLDNSKIAKIEDGRFNISLSTLVELAGGLEVHPSDLFRGDFNWLVV
ncbi:helix-turn-helix domain-containing protein [Flavitalea flava]